VRDNVLTVSGETTDLGLLDPATLRIEAGPANTLRLQTADRCYPRVIAVWAFPFTDRKHWVAFRDAEDKPIGMIRDVQELDRESRAALLSSLERRYFLPRIEKVYAAREEFGLLTLDAETDRGRVVFTVNNPRENIHWIGPTRILFVDAEENRYEVADYEALDARSQSLLGNVI
jgi:hypothetical protein